MGVGFSQCCHHVDIQLNTPAKDLLLVYTGAPLLLIATGNDIEERKDRKNSNMPTYASRPIIIRSEVKSRAGYGDLCSLHQFHSLSITESKSHV